MNSSKPGIAVNSGDPLLMYPPLRIYREILAIGNRITTRTISSPKLNFFALFVLISSSPLFCEDLTKAKIKLMIKTANADGNERIKTETMLLRLSGNETKNNFNPRIQTNIVTKNNFISIGKRFIS
jgi:hypothetical protein